MIYIQIFSGYMISGTHNSLAIYKDDITITLLCSKKCLGPPTRLVIDELSRIIDEGGFTVMLLQDGSSYTASRVA